MQSDDGAHDVAHLLRVWKSVQQISQHEGGDLTLLCAAVLLHDCVAVEKNSPQRHLASQLAAEKAGDILASLDWPNDQIEAVCHAIAAHSFSAGLQPQTLEAKILQDADRLDAIGMVGVARCFYVAGRMHSALYDVVDPQAERRDYDDKQFALDHFPAKLFKLQQGFQTSTGQQLAAKRSEQMRHFVDAFMDEI
nr:HD domain-containing protein [Serratia microhaemolytica]